MSSCCGSSCPCSGDIITPLKEAFFTFLRYFMLTLLVAPTVMQAARWTTAKYHTQRLKRANRCMSAQNMMLKSELRSLVNEPHCGDILNEPLAQKNAQLKELRNWVSCSENSASMMSRMQDEKMALECELMSIIREREAIKRDIKVLLAVKKRNTSLKTC